MRWSSMSEAQILTPLKMSAAIFKPLAHVFVFTSYDESDAY